MYRPSFKTKNVMNKDKFCQSCSMPLKGTHLYGTEKDGSPSLDYCIYCYKNGAFTDPDLTLDQMRHCMIRKMDSAMVPEDIIEAAINRLPGLKRWADTTKQPKR